MKDQQHLPLFFRDCSRLYSVFLDYSPILTPLFYIIRKALECVVATCPPESSCKSIWQPAWKLPRLSHDLWCWFRYKSARLPLQRPPLLLWLQPSGFISQSYSPREVLTCRGYHWLLPPPTTPLDAQKYLSWWCRRPARIRWRYGSMILLWIWNSIAPRCPIFGVWCSCPRARWSWIRTRLRWSRHAFRGSYCRWTA